MAITPLDISNKEFPVRFRGYDRDSVDDFLDQVVQEFEFLIKENVNLRDQLELVSQRLEQYRALEETVNKTLVVAQESAEEIKGNAKHEADLILRGAQLQAERIVDSGHAKARQILEENADLLHAVNTLRSQVKALLRSQLDAIDALPNPFTQVASGRQQGETR